MEATTPTGRVLVVATPIGNLGDLSDRARDALAAADLVACEDTRRTGRLLHHLGLDKRLVSMHDHNERARLPMLLERLEQGQVVAVVSDAGTPLLSDPGFVLVREAVARGIPVEAVPGASALMTALVVSALPPYPVTFVGFPPPKTGKRRRFFTELRGLNHTMVFFESPHRLLKSLADAEAVFGNPPVAVCRELTKLHEEVIRGRLRDVVERLAARPGIKGELVVVLDARHSDRQGDGSEDGKAASSA